MYGSFVLWSLYLKTKGMVHLEEVFLGFKILSLICCVWLFYYNMKYKAEIIYIINFYVDLFLLGSI